MDTNIPSEQRTGCVEAGHQAGEGQGDPSQSVYLIYLTLADEHDKAMIEMWRAEMNGMIIFAGLFCNVVAAFMIENFRNLTADPVDEKLATLILLLQGRDSVSNTTYPNQPPFEPSPHVKHADWLWSWSLALSLSCALVAISVNGWGAWFLLRVNQHSVPSKRASTRTSLFRGVKDFYMPELVHAVPGLFHASLFLFWAGLAEFMESIHKKLRISLDIYFVITSVWYIALTIVPTCIPQFPFQTPFTNAVSALVHFITRLWYTLLSLKLSRPLHVTSHTMPNGSKSQECTMQDDWIDWMLQWTVQHLVKDQDLTHFVQALPGFMTPPNGSERLQKLLKRGLGYRIVDTIVSCSHARVLDAAQRSCADACMRTVLLSPCWFGSCQKLEELVTALTRLTTVYPSSDALQVLEVLEQFLKFTVTPSSVPCPRASVEAMDNPPPSSQYYGEASANPSRFAE